MDHLSTWMDFEVISFMQYVSFKMNSGSTWRFGDTLNLFLMVKIYHSSKGFLFYIFYGTSFEIAGSIFKEVYLRTHFKIKH